MRKQKQKQKRDLARMDNKAVSQRDKKQKPREIVSLDVDKEGQEPLELSPETTLDLLQDAQKARYREQVSRHTNDETIQESLVARQDLKSDQTLSDRKGQHHAKSPILSGGDVDAAWDEANVGEETVGGMAPTPDQDVVEEIGAAVGIEYEDDEPLRTGDKLAKRDRQRWELNPESAKETS